LQKRGDSRINFLTLMPLLKKTNREFSIRPTVARSFAAVTWFECMPWRMRVTYTFERRNTSPRRPNNVTLYCPSVRHSLVSETLFVYAFIVPRLAKRAGHAAFPLSRPVNLATIQLSHPENYCVRYCSVERSARFQSIFFCSDCQPIFRIFEGWNGELLSLAQWQFNLESAWLCDKTSHATNTRQGYVQCSCQSTRVWQRHRTRPV